VRTTRTRRPGRGAGGSRLAAPLRAAWSAGPGSLTARGAALALAGALSGGLGLALGHRDLVRLGVLLLALPVVGWALARSSSPTLVVERTVSPGVVPVGGSASVRLDLHGRGRGGPTLLGEDVVPPVLRASPRFVVERLAAGTSASVRYGLVGVRRGRHPVGPLRVVTQDAFGLVALSRSSRAVDPLLVVPALQLLAPLRVRGGGAGASSVDPGAGEDDVVPREYRHGDDRRRVHWRTSARRGELMVRRDERPRRAGAAVLLDRGAGDVVGADPTGREAFERAVTAVASAGERLALDGVGVRLLLGAAGDAVRADARGRPARLERLALVEPELVPEAPTPGRSTPATGRAGGRPGGGPGRRPGRPAAGAHPAPRAGAPRSAAALRPAGSTGGAPEREGDALAAALAALRGHREDVLVAVCSPWSADALVGAAALHRVALVVARGDDGAHDAAVAQAVRTLHRGGWGAAVLGPADDLAAVWAAAQRPGGPPSAAGPPAREPSRAAAPEDAPLGSGRAAS